MCELMNYGTVAYVVVPHQLQRLQKHVHVSGNDGGVYLHSSSDCCHDQLQQPTLVLSFQTFLLDYLRSDMHSGAIL
jgi:hypothetical protein